MLLIYSKDVRSASTINDTLACLVMADTSEHGQLWAHYSDVYAIDAADFVVTASDRLPTVAEALRTGNTVLEMLRQALMDRDRLQAALDWAKANDLVPPGLGDPGVGVSYSCRLIAPLAIARVDSTEIQTNGSPDDGQVALEYVQILGCNARLNPKLLVSVIRPDGKEYLVHLADDGHGDYYATNYSPIA